MKHADRVQWIVGVLVLTAIAYLGRQAATTGFKYDPIFKFVEDITFAVVVAGAMTLFARILSDWRNMSTSQKSRVVERINHRLESLLKLVATRDKRAFLVLQRAVLLLAEIVADADVPMFVLKPKIHRVPGRWIDAVMEFCYRPKTYNAIFKPLLAELQFEYMEVLAAGRPWRARALRVIYVYAFMKAALAHGLAEMIDVVRKVVK